MASFEGDQILVLFHNIIVSEIWPNKMGGLWWEWPNKRGGLWWEWPNKRGATVLVFCVNGTLAESFINHGIKGFQVL